MQYFSPSLMWDEEDDVEWRNRRRAQRQAATSVQETYFSPMELGVLRAAENFGSNITTSSVSSVRTKNTFIEVQDEDERVELERRRSARSRSLPPQIPREAMEDLQLQMASYFLNQLVSLEVPVETPAPRPAAVKKKSKKQKAKIATQAEGGARLFIGGLSTVTSSETLHAYFSKYGHLSEAQVILDKRSRNSRGFGFVAFTDGLVPRAVLEDQHTIDDTLIGVRLYGTE